MITNGGYKKNGRVVYVHHQFNTMTSQGRLLYNFHVNVANVILEYGVIFGGYVRDTLLHNHHAEAFYTKVGDEDVVDINALYEDQLVHKDNIDRLLLPEDIDCFMTSAKMEKMVSFFTNSSSRFKLVMRRDTVCGQHNSKYFTNMRGAPLGLTVTHLVLGLVHNPIYEGQLPYEFRTAKVYIDILHAPSLEGKEPPFGDMDFECNCLVMDSFGNIRLSGRYAGIMGLQGYALNQHQKLCQVVDDVMKRVAVPVTASSFDRTSKMATKGWKIKEAGLNIVIIDEDDTCPICFDGGKEQLRIKADCCKSTYHPHCFAKFVTFNSGQPLSCPTCRSFMSREGIACMKVKMWPT